MSLAILSVYQYSSAQELQQANWFYSSLMRRVRDETIVIAEVVYGQPKMISPDVIRFTPANYISQKMRVYNELVSRLPKDCDKVLVIEPNIFFLSSDWLGRISRALDRFQVVVPFTREVIVQEPKRFDFDNWHEERAFTFLEANRCIFRHSLASAVATAEAQYRDECRRRSSVNRDLPSPRGQAGSLLRGRKISSAFAWAFRREVLDRFGLYDRFLVQHDLLVFNMLASAVYDDFGAIGADHETSLKVCSDEYLAPYFDWAMPLGEYVGQSVGYADNVAMRFNVRQPAPFSFRMEGFSPEGDVEVEGGLLAWRGKGASQTDIERYNLRHWNYLNAIRL